VQRIKTVLAFIGALTLLGLGFVAVRACGDDTDPSARIGPGPPPVTSTTATSGSPTLDKIVLRKRLIVSMPRDRVGLSAPGPDGQLAGFDVEIARIVAVGLGLPGDAVSFKPLPPTTVDDALASGDVDLAFGGITGGSVAGPYLATTVDVLVPAGAAPRDVAALGTARVCAVTGTGDADLLRTKAPGARVTEVGGIKQCLTQLRAGQAAAIVADDALLRGVAAAEPGSYRLLGGRLADRSHGIGLPPGDEVLRTKVNDILAEAASNGRWQTAYTATLGPAGIPATPPPTH
jgi:glutamate transport system substrate-binding protein